MELLERENQRLRRELEELVGPDNPCFNRAAFQSAMRFYMMWIMAPLELLFVPVMIFALVPGWAPDLPAFGPVRLVDLAGVGIVAAGGLGVGVVALGGLAIGLVAVGGGALGVLAIGGGAVGVLAFGGGAIGYIAVGGGAIGRYALGGSVWGKAGFSLKRQDPEAVQFFVRWLPRFKAAVSTPLPVIPLNPEENPHAS